MSASLPAVLDAWRMVAARRCFEGTLPLSALPRLLGSLADREGDCRYALEFGRDALQVNFLELRLEAKLPLICQRSLERFELPVRIVQRLGLIADEAQEAALPPGYEAVLVDADGMLHPAELIEDELILAVPVVPVGPGSVTVEREWPAAEKTEDAAPPHPFAALAALKTQKNP